MDPLVGRTLGRYRIVDELSRGGMGVVYRAVDTRLNRDVAIKVLPAELLSDPDRTRRFLTEAQTASQLEHPNIGVIHEIDDADGVSFIAMELIGGEKLSAVIARGHLPVVRAIGLATEVAEGLAFAHGRGVVHRDVKPANVMVTEHGHAKIIDFGLAKLVGALSGDGAETATAGTDPGTVLGTASYMSPEQARGAKVDARSDIFSFGVMLFEMLARRAPFERQTGLDTLHALLHDAAPPLPTLGPDVGPDAAHDLQRIVDKCLAKDPDQRYQGMLDVVVDLRAVRRRLESGAATLAPTSGPIPSRPARSPSSFPTRAVWTAAAVVAVVLLGLVIWPRIRRDAPSAIADSGKPTLAVLYFQNNTGSAQLDWLHTGLTDMVVTDLSQSPDLDVLSSDRLFQILRDLRRENDPVIAFDTVQKIAQRAGVKHVLLGNYQKAGDTIRINATLQDAATGRIISAERIDAAGESNLFSIVDELTRRIKLKFPSPSTSATQALLAPPGGRGELGMFRNLSEVTTASPEAYRYYAQGIDLHQRGQEHEAIPLFEKAIEIDPDFALAMTKLSVVHGNTGHWDLRNEYAKRALDHAARLSPRERYYVEGSYYGNFDDTIAQSIDAFKKLIAIYPNHQSGTHNLAAQYDNLERYDEAIPLYESLLQRPAPFAFTYSNLAVDYVHVGKIDKARAVMNDLLTRDPSNVSAYWNLAALQTAWDEPDEAVRTLDSADRLNGPAPESNRERWMAAIRRGQLAEAAALAAKTEQSTDSFAKFTGAIQHALGDLYAGHSVAALATLQRASTSQPGGSDQTARARGWAADLLLRLGRPAPALTQAQAARREARTSNAGWESDYYEILAHSRLGHSVEAANAVQTLTAKANALPSNREKRQIHWLNGVLALDRHQTSQAVDELRQAESMLPARGVHPPAPPHAPIWFDLGEAYLAAGDMTNAAAQFQRVVERTEAIRYPIEFVRSLYWLGHLAAQRGDRAQARASYQRFVEYWGDGDMDRERVLEARKWLALNR